MFSSSDKVIFETDTAYGHYQVLDMNYEGRLARVLYSGKRQAAQSGVARDGKTDLLFDYNQRLYELVTGVLPRKLLLIGGGVYTLPMALLQALPRLQIDVVELDPGLDDIASRFFDFQPDPRLHIFHTDGLSYLQKATTKYDMIIFDAFVQTDIPESLSSRPAIELAKQCLTDTGMVAANIISSYYGRSADVINRHAKLYAEVFGNVTIFPASHSQSLWLSQNLLLIAQVGKPKNLDKHLRYQSLDQDSNPYNVASDLGV